ncbi:MAG: glycosyltransferase [Actinomycetota bacterium]
MRILLVTTSYPPFLDAGGPPVKVRAIAEGMAERGNQVTVLTANHNRGQRRHVGRAGGVEVIFLRILLRYRSIPVTSGVRAFVRRHLRDFDVVHIFGIYDTAGPIIARAARRRRIPYVVEPMGMFKPIVRSFAKKRMFHAVLGRSLLARAARVIATAEQEREELIGGGLPSGRVVVRRNGLDLLRFRSLPERGAFRSAWGLPADDAMTLFLGRLAVKKRPEVLVEAFAQAGAPGWLVFVGPDEDDYSERLRALAVRRGIGERLVITGPIFGEREKLAALVDADVFALPSENENFGNSIAEAIACGVPVVISDRCGIAPFVADRAGLVEPLDVGSFADGLRRIHADGDLRARFAAAGPEVARELSWDEPFDEQEALYRDIIERGG